MSTVPVARALAASSERLTGEEARANGRLVIGLVALHALALGLVASTAWPLALIGTLLVGFVSPSLWAAIHEAIHGHLLAGARGNDRAGRLLAVLHGAPFDVLRYGHLTHHRTNGEPAARPDIVPPPPASPRIAWLGFYARLLGGLYLFELAALPLAALPRRALEAVFRRHGALTGNREESERAARHLLDPARLRRIRTDAALIVVAWGAAFGLAGAAWPWLLAGLAARALLVSLLDNAPHHAGPLGDRRQGHDTAVPAALAPALLNMNLHGTHHRHPNLPWRRLPDAFRADGGRLHGPLLGAVLRQLAGPLPPP